jgi:hypothetical protein
MDHRLRSSLPPSPISQEIAPETRRSGATSCRHLQSWMEVGLEETDADFWAGSHGSRLRA